VVRASGVAGPHCRYFVRLISIALVEVHTHGVCPLRRAPTHKRVTREVWRFAAATADFAMRWTMIPGTTPPGWDRF